MRERVFKGISLRTEIGIREAITGIAPPALTVRSEIEALGTAGASQPRIAAQRGKLYSRQEEKSMDGSSFYQDEQSRRSKTVKGL